MDIGKDNRSGSRRISENALLILRDRAALSTGLDIAHFLRDMEAECDKLIAAQPAMASVFNRVTRFRGKARTVCRKSDNVMEAKRALIMFIEKEIKASLVALEKIALLGMELIPAEQAVMTYSQSGTVKEILARAFKNRGCLQVLITEGRPVCEGQSLASSLARMGIDVVLAVDAAGDFLISKAGILIVGADRVTEKGVVNKIGAKALAMLARDAGVPVYAAFEKDKFLDESRTPLQDRRHPSCEVFDSDHPRLQVLNPYFELTPAALFTGYVTEDGVSDPR